jgi:hypothetical protein
MVHPRRIALALCLPLWLCALVTQASERVADPVEPATFLPGGLLGVQLGSSWEAIKHGSTLGHWTCQGSQRQRAVFDEVCFFKSVNRVAGAEIHDGFVAHKGDRVVLIGTGIAIKNLDDPLAAAVMRDFQTQVHAGFQQTGDEVLFVNMPERTLSAQEMVGFSQTAPVLLVALEPEQTELAVMYGYLAPVNVFSVLTHD